MRSDERRGDGRLGETSRPDRAWEVYREVWVDAPGLPWSIYHPDVNDETMPNDGRFASWQEAMDFVWEYERVKDWAREHDYVAMAMTLDPVVRYDRATKGWDYLMSYPEDDLEGDIVMGIRPPSAAHGRT
jgi:hypothetical protein